MATPAALQGTLIEEADTVADTEQPTLGEILRVVNKRTASVNIFKDHFRGLWEEMSLLPHALQKIRARTTATGTCISDIEISFLSLSEAHMLLHIWLMPLATGDIKNRLQSTQWACQSKWRAKIPLILWSVGCWSSLTKMYLFLSFQWNIPIEHHHCLNQQATCLDLF